jgi:hypothetical protein
MTKLMLALAVLVALVLALGMSQGVAASPGVKHPVDAYRDAVAVLASAESSSAQKALALADLERLARAGWAIAQHRLGEYYAADADAERSRGWYQRAADLHYAPSVAALEAPAASSNSRMGPPGR